MVAWFESLSSLERIFAYVAIPSTILLILQLILLLIGLGGGSDVDSATDIGDVADATDFDGGDITIEATDIPDGGFEADVDPGLHIFSLRGIIAFMTIFGWTGIAVSKSSGGNIFLSVAVALAAGFATMVAIAYIFKAVLKLQSNGSLDYRNALGLPATVYLTIPPARSDKGKINTILQGRYIEADAVTDEETPIKYGEEVVVIGLSGNNTLIVKRK